MRSGWEDVGWVGRSSRGRVGTHFGPTHVARMNTTKTPPVPSPPYSAPFTHLGRDGMGWVLCFLVIHFSRSDSDGGVPPVMKREERNPTSYHSLSTEGGHERGSPAKRI